MLLNNEWWVEKCAEFKLLVEIAWPLKSKDTEKCREPFFFFLLALITCCYWFKAILIKYLELIVYSATQKKPTWHQRQDLHNKQHKILFIMNNNRVPYTVNFKSRNWYSPYLATPVSHLFLISLLTGWLEELSWWAGIIFWPLLHPSTWIRDWGSLCDPHYPRRCLKQHSWCSGICRIMWFQFIADTIAMQTMAQENEAVFEIAM